MYPKSECHQPRGWGPKLNKGRSKLSASSHFTLLPAGVRCDHLRQGPATVTSTGTDLHTVNKNKPFVL